MIQENFAETDERSHHSTACTRILFSVDIQPEISRIFMTQGTLKPSK